MAENFPYLGRDEATQVHEAYRYPKKFNSKRSFPRHIIIKLSKINNKERILKAAREKKTAYKGTPLGYQQNSQCTLYRPEESEIIYLKYLKKNCQSTILNLVIILQICRRNKGFPRQTKAKRVHHYQNC